ncbi:MAG TPA: branched-chain amino acid ABC transporter permease [Candidatus Baltobacteraceae bacterium]|nr:branched-chain amino acid ABC transporter permease [Candidatus Baltobacteraceae bacterium]
MFLQQLVNGLVLGGAYALIAVGMTMIFGIMNISNFAHGTIYMLGAYAVYFLSTVFKQPFFLAVALAMFVVGLVGIAIERIVFRPVYGGPVLNDLLIALGLSFVLENGALLLWGSQTKSVRAPFTDTVIRFAGVSVTLQRLVVLFASVILIGALYIFLNRTRYGKAIVATAQNPKGAALVGIDLDRVYMGTFAISSALAAAAGALLAPLFYVFPTMGNMPLLKAFVVVVLGGMGNVQGAVVGGFLVGVAESLGGAYISSDYKNVFSFIILISVLLVRPQGLFGRSESA